MAELTLIGLSPLSERGLCDNVPLMRALGKMLQLCGLLLPPLTILAELSGYITSKQMLLFLVTATSAFWIGRIIEGWGTK